jgi:glycosyltransferase A (GT-A) superfamily protein (DUF2064 family)
MAQDADSGNGCFCARSRRQACQNSLDPLLGSQAAAGFQAALISDTLRKVARLKGCVQPYLFLAGNYITFARSHAETILRVQSCAPPHIGEFRVIRQKGKGLGERLANAFARLLRLHPSCMVIGTDSPLFPARLLRQALRELHVCESVLGPCPDGGYYLIALRRPADPGILRGISRKVRWGTAFAFSDTLRNLLQLGLSCSILEECADVDLPRDFQRLKKDLSRNRRARRLAPATWRLLKEGSRKAPVPTIVGLHWTCELPQCADLESTSYGMFTERRKVRKGRKEAKTTSHFALLCV